MIAPKRPKTALKILRCFYPKNEGRTLGELMHETSMREKALRYYMTKLRKWKILWTKRRWCASAVYYLDHRGFHARIDTLFCDPLKALTNGPPRWQPSTSANLAEVTPHLKAVKLFTPTSTGRCYSCDTITKTNSDNLCAICFKENGGG